MLSQNMLAEIIDIEAAVEGNAIKSANQCRCKLHNRPSKVQIKGVSQKPRRIVTTLTRKRRKTMAAPENETKEARFVRLATMRTSKALRSISLLGNLSTGSYCYTPEQVSQIETALYGEVEGTMAKFNKATIKSEKGFSFSNNS